MQRLSEGETLVCAYAEPSAGPGWSNRPLWLIVRDREGRLHERCLQPHEQPPTVLALYDVAAAAHEAVTGWAREHLRGGGN